MHPNEIQREFASESVAASTPIHFIKLQFISMRKIRKSIEFNYLFYLKTVQF